MKKTSIYLTITAMTMISAAQALAVPLRLDENTLKAASMQVNREQRAERAQKDPNMPVVEGFCQKMTSFRMGSGYSITITDRLAPSPNAPQKFYSIVGNAEPKNPDIKPVSYKCKVLIKDNGALELSEFKLFEVEQQAPVSNSKATAKQPMK